MRLKYDLIVLLILALLAALFVFVTSAADPDLVEADFSFDKETGVAVFSGENATVTLEKYGDLYSLFYNHHKGIVTEIIDEGIVEIESMVFLYHDDLVTLRIADSVKSIGWGNYYDCPELETVYLGSGLETIREGVFSECPNLTDVYYNGDMIGWAKLKWSSVRDGKPLLEEAHVHYSGDVSGTVSGVGNDGTEWIFDALTGEFLIAGIGAMDDGLERAPYNAWHEYAGSVTSVVITGGLENIGSSAFRDFSGVEEATVPEGVTDIGDGAFDGCSELKSVSLPEGLERIGSNAFADCSGLTDIYFGGSEAEWNEVKIESGNDFGGATVHFAKDGGNDPCVPGGSESAPAVPGGNDPASGFTDVPEDAWYAPYVADCVAKGLMTGTSETTFLPEEEMTRAMLVQTLYKYYQRNIQGTGKDLDRLGHDQNYIGGYVGTVTRVGITHPFTLEQPSTVETVPGDPSSEREVVYSVTRDELVSGYSDGAVYVDNVKDDGEGAVSFGSMGTLALVPGSPSESCMIYMSGGICVASGFSGYADRVTVTTDRARVEAITPAGAKFEITLCDLATRTAVIVKGKSAGDLAAELDGYDLAVTGADGEYTVEVYEWSWEIAGGALRKLTCAADTVESCVLPFDDVRDGAYYVEALKWAARLGLTAGVSETRFGPDVPVTREQIATFLKKFVSKFHLKYATYDREYSFIDGDDISSFAREAVDVAARTGMMVGDNCGRFNPKAQAKRCQVAAVFSNLDNVISE